MNIIDPMCYPKRNGVMKKPHAAYRYVHSKVTVYHNCRIELKWRRSRHHCKVCSVVDKLGIPCGSIHYGICTPVSISEFVALKDDSPSSPNSLPVKSILIPKSVPDAAFPVPQSDEQTIINGTKESEIIRKEIPAEKELKKEKENTDIAIELNSVVDTNSISNSKKESKIRKENNSKQQRTAIPNSVNIPKFYFPEGRPSSVEDVEAALQKVSQAFSRLEGGKATKQNMGDIAKACYLPLYWKCPLFWAAGGEKQGFVTYQTFSAMWRKLTQTCHDSSTRFVKIMSRKGNNYLTEEDFVPFIQDVVDTHPGLTFLLEAPEFHSRYVNTVIARIFYCINRSWSGRITAQELRKSNFLQIVQLLEDEDDINQIMDYFSYEHFYVIYCKFWELDKDHDLYIDRNDLARHNDHAINMKVIDRIFSGSVTRGNTFKEGKMSYPEFVWFLLSEEDKRHPTSIEYWFRCMDLDGDGIISMYEMEYFYEEQMQKMEALGIERLPFEDCLCQMLDLVRPKDPEKITLWDLKNCKMTNIFFDTFFNLDKFLEHEQKDPFTNLRDIESDVPEPTDWEKYAAEEYELLVAEEGANDVNEEIHYEDDFEPDEETSPEDARMTEPVQRTNITQSRGSSNLRNMTDDIYDFGSVKKASY
ncbi:hypothetical protein ACJMK2_019424 [Sinanodonta woodiana]|uniref:EF-hand domain-containing protein n=1 Tax=Sinanodonta woodiana TaxID=1069815 RepID=A0ABD3UGB9_SINWO